MLYAIPAQVRQIAVNIRQRNARDEINVDVADVDSVQRLVGQRRIALLLQIPEEIPHVQIVFIHRALGVRLDGLVVTEEIQQQLGRIQTIVHSQICFGTG